MQDVKQEWIEPLLSCAETLYVIDEQTKKLLWCSNAELPAGEYCYRALLGKEHPCDLCPRELTEDVYQWELYDDRRQCWLKVKNRMLQSDGRLLRLGNCNVIDDAMRLSRDSIQMATALKKLLDENKSIKTALEREANFDRMTGLYNRNRFNLDLADGRYDCGRVGVLYFDLNNLKTVNDNLGHEAGDRLIRRLGEAIETVAQATENAAAYRIGGDEFVLMITACQKQTVTDAHTRFSEYLTTLQTTPPCVVAVGEGYAAERGSGEKLIVEADRAMYENKQLLKAKAAAAPAEGR